MKIIIAQKLKELRAAKGCTQEDFSGVSVDKRAVRFQVGEGRKLTPTSPFCRKLRRTITSRWTIRLGSVKSASRNGLIGMKPKARSFRNIGKIPEEVALWRETLKEFFRTSNLLSQSLHARFLSKVKGTTSR